MTNTYLIPNIYFLKLDLEGKWKNIKLSLLNSSKTEPSYIAPLVLPGLSQEVAQTLLPVLTSCTAKLVVFF